MAAAQPKIVETGDVQLAVKPGSLLAAFNGISGLATGAGGFVADSSTSTGTGPGTARLVLRVANTQVHQVLVGVGRYGRVTTEALSGQDVTGEVVDLAARTANLDAEQLALRTLLANAKAIGDILAIQSQLFDVESQIEQLTGQQDALAAQTTYATVSVELAETGKPTAPPAVPHRPSALHRAWHLAGSHTVTAALDVILALGWLTPLLIVAAPLVVAAVAWRRRRRGPVVLEPGAPASGA